MERSFKHHLILVVLPVGGIACLLGLGAGFWCLLQGAGPGTLLIRGALALLVSLLLALLVALVVGIRLSRQAGLVLSGLRALAQQESPPQSDRGGVSELVSLREETAAVSDHLRQLSKEQKAQARNESRLARQDALVRLTEGVAREVQKPLAGVIGFAEMALKQPGIEGQLKNYLTMIAQEARAGRESLENIVRYGRDEPFATEPLDLNELLVQTSQSILSTSEVGTIRLQLNLAENLPQVSGDTTQLMQVFSTLISNAREAMLPDGGTIELSTSLQSAQQLVVMIKDSGRGIALAEQDKVFTPFFTSKGTRRGAGLNLAIADSIVRRHDGRIEFFSTSGEGTVIFVYLPVEGATST